MPPPPVPETMRQRLSRFMTRRRDQIGPSKHVPIEVRERAPGIRYDDDPDIVAYRDAVFDDLRAIDAAVEQVRAAVASLKGAPDRRGYGHLRVKLTLLRREVEADLARSPTARTASQSAYVDIRALQLQETCRASAARHHREGDHRAAITATVDSLRARMIAEHEIGLRGRLSGY